MLGDDITIVVLGVEGDRVKLGIKAPPSVSILRGELHAQVKAANTSAAVAPSVASDMAASLRNHRLARPSQE
jgi:carbon storage regulator